LSDMWAPSTLVCSLRFGTVVGCRVRMADTS